MLYVAHHGHGLSLVEARNPQSAKKFIKEYFGRSVEPISITNDKKEVDYVKGCNAKIFEVGFD